MLQDFDLSGIDPKAQLLDLDRTESEESLYVFLKTAWPYMDPGKWIDGWHLDAICEHLQAVVDGQIRRLIINLPPRHGKSLLLSVAFPAWTWAQPIKTATCGPGVPFLYASYADKLSLRDSVKCRRLIESPWYQARWGHRFQIASDQNTKSRFTNNQGGERLITSIGAGVTGEGGNIICIDDPNAANDIASEATTEETINWWTTAMPTRLNDPETGAYIIIQQRLAENDLTGHIQENELEGWTQLILPGRYEPERNFTTSIGWSDPRTEPGQLLWPERFSEAALRRLEVTMGPWTFAGQIMQRPEPKGGGIIKSDWWRLWDKDRFPKMDFIIATLDTAYTTKEQNDPSALIVWGIFSADTQVQPTRAIDKDNKLQYREDLFGMDTAYAAGAPKVMMMTSWVARLELHELVAKVAKTCTKTPEGGIPVDLLLVENKASGISVAQELRRLYSNENFSVQLFDPKSQDKMARLYSVQHLFAEGLIYAPDTKWAQAVIKQCGQFPKGTHDDLVDCVSMGLRTLRDMGLLARAPERAAELEELQRYKGRQEPLYSV